MREVTLAGLAILTAACAGGPPQVQPIPSTPALASRLAPAAAVLDSAIAAGAAPGAVLAVSYRGEHFFHSAGHYGIGDSRRPDPSTLYDMASLTKVIALTTVSMMAVNDGKLDLDARVISYLPEFGRGLGAKSSVTVRDLLLHDSGLPAHRPLWLETAVRPGGILRAITSDLNDDPGTRMVYSDLGAITLTAILEKQYGMRFDDLFRTRVAEPLRMTRSRFTPPKGWRKAITPTETDPWRGRTLLGEVHDENTARLGGISGHAGLFSTAEDLIRFTEWAMAGTLGRQTTTPVQPPSQFDSWTRRQDVPVGSSRALGWDTPSGRSSAGSIMGNRSYGHTGFTGTSIWIDPEREVIIVLLTNRVHPTRNTPLFTPLRPAVADAVMRSLGFDDPRPADPQAAR